jgi:hypothetical protein
MLNPHPIVFREEITCQVNQTFCNKKKHIFALVGVAPPPTFVSPPPRRDVLMWTLPLLILSFLKMPASLFPILTFSSF